MSGAFVRASREAGVVPLMLFQLQPWVDPERSAQKSGEERSGDGDGGESCSGAVDHRPCIQHWP